MTLSPIVHQSYTVDLRSIFNPRLLSFCRDCVCRSGQILLTGQIFSESFHEGPREFLILYSFQEETYLVLRGILTKSHPSLKRKSTQLTSLRRFRLGDGFKLIFPTHTRKISVLLLVPALPPITGPRSRRRQCLARRQRPRSLLWRPGRQWWTRLPRLRRCA